MNNEKYYVDKQIRIEECKLCKLNELRAVVKNIEERSQRASDLVSKIVAKCREHGLDDETLEKMNRYPTKIRQILSVHKFDDTDLTAYIDSLKTDVSQLVIVKENRLSEILDEIAGIKTDCGNLYKKRQEIENQMEDCRSACINNLKELNLAMDIDAFMQEYQSGNTEQWLKMLLDSLNSNSHPTHIESKVDSGSKKVLKCFIAGSLALCNERNAIISGVNDLNLANNHSRYRIECYTFNNFNKYVSPNGQQHQYDSFIKEEADVCIFVLDNVVGGVTEQEFTLAYECWESSDYQRPRVYVFSNKANDNEIPSESIVRMRKCMAQHKQYWIDYSSIEVLNLKSQLLLQALYENGLD